MWGRGVNDEGIRVGETVPVYVDNSEYSPGAAEDLRVRVVSGMSTISFFKDRR